MPLFGEQLAVRELLWKEAGAAGVAWTVGSTGIFMSFLIEAGFWVLGSEYGARHREPKTVKARVLGSWENGVTVTTVGDIGPIVARLVCQSEEVETAGKVVYMAGETISYGRLVEILEKIVERKVERKVWSVECGIAKGRVEKKS
jgi:hypothetical protein